MSRFIDAKDCKAVESRLANQKLFELENEQFDQFIAALDAPPRAIPAVQRLFADKSVIERDRKGPSLSEVELESPTLQPHPFGASI